MSAGEDSDDADILEGTVLEEQLEQCDAIMRDIMADRLDPQDEENIYTKIDHQYGRTKKKTKEVLSDRFESEGLNTAFKTLIFGFIEAQGFQARLGPSGGKRDNLEAVTRWFKLYSAVVLENSPKIPFEFALTRFKEYRDVVIVHPDGIPAATDRPEASLLGFLTLSWTAMEEILRLWEEILLKSTPQLTSRESALDSKNPKFGFINTQYDKHGFVTTFPEGEEGNSTYFQVGDAKYFPKEGDIVKVKDESGPSQHDSREATRLWKYKP